MAIAKLNLFNSALLLLCLCSWTCSTNVQAIKVINSNNTITFNNTVFVTNYNNFKTNLDSKNRWHNPLLCFVFFELIAAFE